MQETSWSSKLTLSRERWLGIAPCPVRRVQMAVNRQVSVSGQTLRQRTPGDLTRLARQVSPHDLVVGGISRAGSRQGSSRLEGSCAQGHPSAEWWSAAWTPVAPAEPAALSRPSNPSRSPVTSLQLDEMSSFSLRSQRAGLACEARMMIMKSLGRVRLFATLWTVV